MVRLVVVRPGRSLVPPALLYRSSPAVSDARRLALHASQDAEGSTTESSVASASRSRIEERSFSPGMPSEGAWAGAITHAIEAN